jgi:hypothetical protein
MPRPIDWIVLNRPRGIGAGAVSVAHRDLEARWPGVEILDMDLAVPGPAGDRCLEMLAHHCGRAR